MPRERKIGDLGFTDFGPNMVLLETLERLPIRERVSRGCAQWRIRHEIVSFGTHSTKLTPSVTNGPLPAATIW